MRIKSWESPRRRGRNHKGKGGSARQRQLKKRNAMLKQRLKNKSQSEDKKHKKGGEFHPSFLLELFVDEMTPHEAIALIEFKESAAATVFTRDGEFFDRD